MNVNATAGNTVAGEGNAKVRADGLFALLTLLRDVLAHDDSRGITFAGARLDRGVSNLARVRADTGIRSQRMQQEQGKAPADGYYRTETTEQDPRYGFCSGSDAIYAVIAPISRRACKLVRGTSS